MNDRDEYLLDLYFKRDERAVAETQREYGSFCLDLALFLQFLFISCRRKDLLDHILNGFSVSQHTAESTDLICKFIDFRCCFSDARNIRDPKKCVVEIHIMFHGKQVDLANCRSTDPSFRNIDDPLHCQVIASVGNGF